MTDFWNSWYSWIFFQKISNFLRIYIQKLHLTPIWNLTKFVRNVDFGSKTILQPFRVTKEDHFSYRDHNFWTKIRSCENRFSTTMDFWAFYWFYKQFLYWPLQSFLWGPFHPPIHPKSFFRISILSAEGVRGSNQHYQKVRLDPKDIPNRWHVHRNHIAEDIATFWVFWDFFSFLEYSMLFSFTVLRAQNEQIWFFSNGT